MLTLNDSPIYFNADAGRSSHREEQRRSHHAKPYDRRGGSRANGNRGQDHALPHQQEESPEQRISSFLVRVGDKVGHY